MANFVIDSEEVLKEKVGLISNLIDINTAIQMKAKRLAKKKEAKVKKIEEPNPIDEDFSSLKCSMDPIDPSGKEFKMID